MAAGRGITDIAAALAACLDLPPEYVSYEKLGTLAGAAERDEWDVGPSGRRLKPGLIAKAAITLRSHC